MINGGTSADNTNDPEEWGAQWIAERLKSLDQDEWLSPDRKSEVLESIALLIEKVGNSNVAHLIGCAGWSTLYPAIQWHLEALSSLEIARGGLNFMGRIKRGVIEDGPSILELVWRFVSIGTDIEIEPEVVAHGVPKVPDLALLDCTGQRLCFVEAASNANSADQSESDGFQHRVAPVLFRCGFMKTIAGFFRRILTNEEIAALEQRLNIAADKLAASPNQVLVEDGAYKLIMSDDPGDGTHEKACAQHGIAPRAIAYPPFDPKEEIRTLRKVKKEMEHFPPDSPALIVIEANPLMVLIEDKRERLSVLRNTITPWMVQNNSLIAVTVTTRALAPQPAKTFVSNGDYLIENSLGFTGLDHVLIFNPAFAASTGTALKDTVRRAFTLDFAQW